MTPDPPNSIRYRRHALGLSLRQLAALTGVTHAWLWNLETGIAPNPRLDTMQRIAKALGCSVGALYPTPEEKP